MQAQPRVAIVDDDAPVRRALTRVLGAAQFEVTSFATAEEFLVGGLHPLPDCALIDVHLPMMNGIELRNRIASMVPTIRVVFLTADHQLAGGPHDRPGVWLTKPVDEDTLVTAIAHACGRDTSAASRSAP
jgi:FixJ family two-component response regulator